MTILGCQTPVQQSIVGSINKHLGAIALAGMVAAPLSAQAQSVPIYGRFYPELNFNRMSGATATTASVSTLTAPPSGENFGTVNKVDSSNSRLGLRGSEPLGGGLSAFFQLEQRIVIDTGNPASATLASRDTFAGLAGDSWGLVKLGSMDTVYKDLGDALSFLGVSSGNFVSNSNVASKQPFGNNAAGSFNIRRPNSVWYETPETDGFQALIQYSPDEARNPSRNAYLVSTGVQYDKGALYAAIAYELHNDTFGGSRNVPVALSNSADLNAHSRDWAIRATGQYRFSMVQSDHTLEIDIARLEYRETGGHGGRFEKYRHTTYVATVDSKWPGAWRTALAYTGAAAGSCSLLGGAAPCSADGLDGRQLALGAAYVLSKRTSIFALYAKLWNGHSAQYNNMDGPDVSVGADIQQIALGLLHNF